MKSFFANAEFGMIGLLLFFTLFVGILIWLFWPGSKEKFKSYGQIPLKDGQDE